jgi:hypothetical protein
VKVDVLGMELDEWRYGSCVAHFGIGPNWATLYDIKSKREGHRHATRLLIQAKGYYEGQGKVVGGSVALSDRMSKIYELIGIPEYKEGDVDSFNILGKQYLATKEGAMRT